MNRARAEAFIRSLVGMREEASDKTASGTANLYPTLKDNEQLIAAGTRINHNGKIKRASVDLWDIEANNPDNAPSLWEDISYKDGYRIIPETITVGTAFALNECGWWGDALYKSLLDNNVWTPSAYPSGWAKVNK